MTDPFSPLLTSSNSSSVLPPTPLTTLFSAPPIRRKNELNCYPSFSSFPLVIFRKVCMATRGVMTPGVETTTSAVRGNFKDNSSTKAEFLSLVRTL